MRRKPRQEPAACGTTGTAEIAEPDWFTIAGLKAAYEQREQLHLDLCDVFRGGYCACGIGTLLGELMELLAPALAAHPEVRPDRPVAKIAG
jgi:hypothetical protein